jgi:hypothetical protein
MLRVIVYQLITLKWKTGFRDLFFLLRHLNYFNGKQQLGNGFKTAIEPFSHFGITAEINQYPPIQFHQFVMGYKV